MGRIPGDSVAELVQDLTVSRPVLWSVERPYLYRAVSRVRCGNRLCDTYTTPFGVRSFVFRADSGFFLNGRHVKIRGVCLHHDLGALGASVNTRAIERQLQIMRAMGVNALRTSHNPPAPELLDLTDRMGFVVMDEAFDMWKKEKTPYDYHLDWDAWHVRDLSDMVLRDRNHASVFIWSIGNEVMEQWNNGDSTAAPIARELAGIVRALDPIRPITQAANNGSPQNPVFHAGALDLLGHNYHHEVWADFPAQYPGAKFIITEAMSALNSRGVYEQPSPSESIAVYYTPYEKDKGPQPPKNGRLSSYDNRRAFWGSLHEESLRLFERYPFLSGIFVWQGIDYLGEPTPYEWPARSSYFGVVDLAGFPKDPFYLYQSVWTEQPMLHLLPHWNWTPGDTIDVWAYTNADEVELFLNGTSLGTKRKPEPVSHLMWRVAYTPGTLRAVSHPPPCLFSSDKGTVIHVGSFRASGCGVLHSRRRCTAGGHDTVDAAALPLRRTRREPRHRRRGRARELTRRLRRRRVGRDLEDRGRRRALARGLRQRAGAGDRRARHRALGAQCGVGGDGRNVLHPVDDRAGQRGLPLNRWWPELAAHGSRFHRAHRPHCDRSHESRHRAGLRAGPRLRAPAAARRLSHRGRRSHLDPRPVCGSEHRMLRPRHRSRRSQYAVRRDVAVRGEDMAPAERRAGERAVGVARRRPHVEAPGWSRAARREARRRQSRRRGRALEPEHGVRARRGPRPDALPQRRPRHLLARRVAQPRHGRARAVLRALRRRARR